MTNFFKGKTELFLRNVVFGIEDSLVSTVGLLSGVAVTGVTASTMILTGTVLIFVEGFSMAVGSFISEDSVETYVTHKKNAFLTSFIGGMVMFCSYFLSGVIPLFPYFLFPPAHAFWISIMASLFALFLLGALSAEMFKAHFVRQGIKMLLVGGVAIAVGILAGQFIQGAY